MSQVEWKVKKKSGDVEEQFKNMHDFSEEVGDYLDDNESGWRHSFASTKIDFRGYKFCENTKILKASRVYPVPALEDTI